MKAFTLAECNESPGIHGYDSDIGLAGVNGKNGAVGIEEYGMSENILEPGDGNSLAVCDVVADTLTDDTVDHVTVVIIFHHGCALDDDVFEGYLLEILGILNEGTALIQVISAGGCVVIEHGGVVRERKGYNSCGCSAFKVIGTEVESGKCGIGIGVLR